MDAASEFVLISTLIFGAIGVFNGIGLVLTYKKLKSGESGVRTKVQLAVQSFAQFVVFGFLVTTAYVAWVQRTNNTGYEQIMRDGDSERFEFDVPRAPDSFEDL